MMRKPYIRPEIYIIEAELFTMIATSMGINETKGDHPEDFVRERRRGMWGDLWGEKE